MAKNAIVRLPADTVVELTDADVTKITVIYEGGDQVCRIQGTASGAAAPTVADMQKGLPLFQPGEGWMNQDMGDLFPDVTTPRRVFAWAKEGGHVNVRHA